MWRTTCFAAALAACLLGIVGGSVSTADEGGDYAEERAYARDQLLRRARESVDPSDPAAGGLDEIRAAVEAKRATYAQDAPAELALADLMLGRNDDKGLIRLGAILYRWIAGAAEGELRVFLWNPEARGDVMWFDAEKPSDRWIEWQVRSALPTDSKVGIAGISRLQEGGQDLPYALTHPEELTFWICRPWLEAREKVVEARVKVFKVDMPPRGLVSERTVRRKEARAAVFRKKADDYKRLRDRTLESLDRMVEQEEVLRNEAGGLGFEIEEARRAIEEGRKKDDEDAPDTKTAERSLEILHLRELVGEQKLRLLYVAVRRAALRLELFEEAVRQAREEALAAEGVQKRYEAELSRMRREQQMAQLAYGQKRLRKRREEAEAKAADEKTPNRPVWQAYDQALVSLLALNEITREAVKLRRSLEARSKPEEEEPFVPPALPPCEPPPKPAEGAAEGPAPEPAAKDPLEAFRRPRPSILSAQYVGAATEQLGHPAWSASLAADHYEAVDDRVQALEGALESADAASELEERFEQVRTAAEAALQRVEESALANETGRARHAWRARVHYDRRQILRPTVDAVRETFHGIREARMIMQEDLEVLRAYRTRLLDLGTRSFRIRTVRALDGKRLGTAYDDAAANVGTALRWITLRGEDNAATFLVRNWQRVLILLAAIVVSVFFVRYGRKALDRVLRRMASRVPALRTEPVTVRAEEAQAKRARAVQEAAAKAAEEEALREVSREEAARPQKVGEGGNGGGGGA